ncbi:MAG: helix-turn-helix domain-containing protein [Planctomycetota bacterium]|nr:helix-turn-helix domain-containing protein [Planctomycetota bacterium]
MMAETETTTAPLTLTKEEAAAALNVPVDTLLNLTRTGQLRCVQIGKHKRWLLDDLRQYIQHQRDNEACVHRAG